ncbi:MAG: AsnC family protein [Pseudonocardiaceae bacterium]|nr:AsnC family protein [Pseudonocardiaceae bacterium]
MVATDPVDARLLATVADLGRAAVHDVAARVGMDPREVASRLLALSAGGLPLLVGVECDPNGIRTALANAAPGQGPHGTPSGSYSVPSPPSGSHPVRGTPSGSYPGAAQAPYQQPAGYPAQPPHHSGPHSQPIPAAQPGATQTAQPAHSFGTWGPPQTSTWARGDQGPQGGSGRQGESGQQGRSGQQGHDMERTRPVVGGNRSGKVGQTLETVGLEGEPLAIQLVELQDPADFLFTAAGYQLADGERAVVVHTEMTNKGTVPFPSLPDNYLVLLAEDGRAIGKAPVSLSSRPAYGIGVNPGETAGGHTVFVLSDAVRLREVRWSPQPGDETRSLTWSVED